MEFFKFISQRFRNFFSGDSGSKSEDADNVYSENREKIIAFCIAFLFSLCLWFIVNLSRDFNVTIEVPIEVSDLPADVTVSNEIPPAASVNLSGEGWNIISVYNNPPIVLVNAQSGQVNLADQIRNQVGAFSDLNIIQVEPSQLTIETEQRATKTVPIVNSVQLNLQEQFGLMSDPVLSPDSVMVSGAESKLVDITQWETEEIRLDNVAQDLQREVALKPPDAGMTLEPESINFEVNVAEFTEAEVRVPVRTRNLPAGEAVTYNPSAITVRFDVPLDQYSEIQGSRPFRAYVDYSVIEQDSSGRVAPEIEVVDTDHIVRMRSFQPPRVSYFRIVPQ